MRRFSRRDLIEGWLASQSDAAPNDADAFYMAMSTAFAVDLNKEPPTESTWHRQVLGAMQKARDEEAQLQLVPVSDVDLDHALRFFRYVASRVADVERDWIDGLTLSRSPLEAFVAGGGARAELAAEELREGLLDVLERIVELVWCLPSDRTVTEDDLARCGYEPSDEDE